MNRAVPIAIALASAVLAACNRAPDDLREWRATDHHDTETNAAAGQAPQVSGSAEASLPGLEDVTIVTWQRQCTTCHGSVGRGDGPRGPMVKAKDLTDPAWQASATDSQIAESIVKGKNAMPAFALPPSTVEGLVHLVRLLNRNRMAAGSAASAAKEAHAPDPRPAPSASSNK